MLRLESLYGLILLDVLGDIPGETKVTNFYGAVLVNQEIRWLDIPMHDIGRVHIVHRTERVVHNSNDMLFRNLGAFAHC